MKRIVKLLLLCGGYFLLMGMSEKEYSSEWNQNEIDTVRFSYFPFNHYPLEPFGFKFYDDTLFVYKSVHNRETRDLGFIFCQKIVNQDTVNLIKEFVQLFIIDKTENIILKRVEEPESLYKKHTSVIIQADVNGEITYKEYIVLFPEEEYNPIFLQLCDLFLSIAREHTNNKGTEKSEP